MKKKMMNKKGFTLMEMLIVVAIIAILVAIAIPTFTGQLNKAKVAADSANIRAAYAEAMTKYITNDTESTATTEAMQTSGTANIADQSVTWTAKKTVTVTVKTGTDGNTSVTFTPGT